MMELLHNPFYSKEKRLAFHSFWAIILTIVISFLSFKYDSEGLLKAGITRNIIISVSFLIPTMITLYSFGYVIYFLWREGTSNDVR